MGRKKHTAEEIIAKLRQVDVLVSQGWKVAEAIRAIEVTEVTYYRWRSEYGGLKGDQVKRLKVLEMENLRLRRAISDLTLEKLILKEAASGKFLYSGFIGQLPCVFIPIQCVNGPAEFLLLSDVGACRLMMGSEGVGGAI